MKQTSRLAPDYELEYKGKKDDLPFWIELVRDLEAHSILELGIGTGRVLFPLVKALGQQVKKTAGLEVDVHLLAQAKKKLHHEYPDIEDKVRLIRADMRSFKLKDKFDFIFIPFNTFSLIYELEDRLSLLKTVKKHLKLSGCFTFEVYAPKLELLSRLAKKERVTKKEFLDEAEGIRLVRARKARYYPASQIIDTEYGYKKYNSTGVLIKRYVTKFKLYKFFPTELRLLLENAGFSIKHFWGDYARTKFTDDSRRMIIVAKKKR